MAQSSDDDDDEFDLPPSKSSRKRAALALQKLGERLVAMRAAERVKLPLGEALTEAILEAQRIRSRGALARQFQYIGKLMRNEDVAAIEAAIIALDEAQKAQARTHAKLPG
ncbi:MAG TPA: ribosome biogenesis factor YjgA [Steroidobacteraceae bacterium]|jgi:ribosome-associated protein|nr:ribosome biogenesis factor YjgA [Steroidobacteraceae bacterium]